MKGEKKVWLTLFTSVPVTAVVFIIAFGKRGWSEFISSGGLGIVIIVAAIILIIGSILLTIWFKGYHPEKQMKRLMKKKHYSIRCLCYGMMKDIDNTFQAIATILILCLLLLIPPKFFLLGIVFIILLIIVVNIGIIRYYGDLEFKKMADEMELYLYMPEDMLREELDSGLKKGLHFKSQHLVITEDYIIGYHRAVPKNMISSLQLWECEPQINYRTLKGYEEMCTMILLCKFTNGKDMLIRLGADEIENSHIKKFLEYYNQTDSRLQGKYKGLRELER